MKALGAEWGALDDSAKAPFVGMAAADKERYEAAVTSNPANTKPVSKGPRKMSAYMHFCKERRPALTTELKASMWSTFKNTAVMVALGGGVEENRRLVQGQVPGARGAADCRLRNIAGGGRDV